MLLAVADELHLDLLYQETNSFVPIQMDGGILRHWSFFDAPFRRATKVIGIAPCKEVHARRLRITPHNHGGGVRTCFPSDETYRWDMVQTLEAIVDERGAERLLEAVRLDRRHRALVTILADEPSDAHATAPLSESALAQDWNRPEEDAAWSHLQQVP